MTYFYWALRYLAIGICVGAGILLADQLYLRYGNPHQIAIMEEMLEELYKSQADLLDLSGRTGHPEYSFSVFQGEISFEERCTTHLRAENPGFSCKDRPHLTSGDMSSPESLEDRVENIRRIAIHGTFDEVQTERFKVVRWYTDDEKLSSALEELRSEPRQEPRGTAIQLPDLPPRFSALVCDDQMCLTLSSSSRTKVEGLLLQILN